MALAHGHIYHQISIHALREESDNRRIFVLSEPDNFNPRPPRGERLHTIIGPRLLVAISIHALREESDGVALHET